MAAAPSEVESVSRGALVLRRFLRERLALVGLVIVALLSRAVQAALRSDAVRARFAEQGADVVGGTPEDFAKFLQDETERLASVIRRANIHLD